MPNVLVSPHSASTIPVRMPGSSTSSSTTSGAIWTGRRCATSSTASAATDAGAGHSRRAALARRRPGAGPHGPVGDVRRARRRHPGGRHDGRCGALLRPGEHLAGTRRGTGRAARALARRRRGAGHAASPWRGPSRQRSGEPRTSPRWTESSGVTEMRDEHGWFLPYSPEAGCVRGFASAGERVYAAVEVGGLLRSDDGGGGWRLAGGSDGVPTFGEPASGAIHPDVHSVHVHPSSADHVLAATAGGLYVSTDGGDRWERRNAGLLHARPVGRPRRSAPHRARGGHARGRQAGPHRADTGRRPDVGARPRRRGPVAGGHGRALRRDGQCAGRRARSDGRVLEQRADCPWRDVDGIADGVRAACEVPD